MNLHPVLRWVLWPLSIVYRAIARLRVWCYRCGLYQSKSLAQPVVSVGKPTVGGTGKTPMVIWLAERALAKGGRIAILSRGHHSRRGLAGSHERSSDEVRLFLSRFGDRVPVGVDRDRYAAALRLNERQKESRIDCFLLDDGFQHLKLKRDADIVLIDATNPFGAGFLLPAGPLREHASALSRADFVVITRSDRSPAIESIVRRHSAAPIFYAQTRLRAVVEKDCPLPGSSVVEFRSRRYLVFCGIGNPQAFCDDLSRWGIQSLGSTFFRDHHRYTQPEADQLERLAVAMGATALLCTEKDIFNLDRVQFRLLPVHFCQIDLQINDDERFLASLSNVVIKRDAATEAAVAEVSSRQPGKDRR